MRLKILITPPQTGELTELTRTDLTQKPSPQQVSLQIASLGSSHSTKPTNPEKRSTKDSEPLENKDACSIPTPSAVTRKGKYGNVKWNSRRLSKYDPYFEKYSQQYFDDLTDWRWFKVQAFVESGMNPNAVSRSGAIGVMQILPSTFRQIKRMNSAFQGKSIHDPEWNIAAGIYYNSYLWNLWMNKATSHKHLQLVFASYNAGFGRVVKTLPAHESAPSDLLSPLHRLPKETDRYLKKITYYMVRLRGAAFVHPDEFCREAVPFKPLQIASR